MSPLTAVEVVFAALVVVGVGLFSVPLALIVAGLAGVVACEVHGKPRA